MLKQIACGIFLLATLPVRTAWADEALNQDLYIAVGAGDKAKVEALLAKGADVSANGAGKYDGTMLESAVAVGSKDIVELLIAKGANVNATDKNGDTVLSIVAVLQGKRDMADLLISKGANVNARNPDGRTPLFFAKSREMAELLIAKGADVNVNGTNGTLLSNAIYSPRFEGMAELLIAKGADVNAKDKDGDTPLFDAISGSKIALAGLLIAHGADVNAKTDQGDTALNCLAGIGKRAGKNVPPSQSIDDLASLLIARGVDINSMGKSAHTALFDAILASNEGMAKLLIAKGADVNARPTGTSYSSPFTYSVEIGNKNMVELMITNGADTNSKGSFGRTLVDLAGHVRDAKDKQEIIAMLQAASRSASVKSIERQAGTSPGDFQKLLTEFKGHSENDELRTAIVHLALKQRPAPAIPPEAEAAAGRGAYLFKNAKSGNDTLSAAKEYLTAIEAAPWVANYYYNLCTVLEKTPYSQQALHACKLYLAAAPTAADAGDMRQRIAGLQYAADRDKAQMKQRTRYSKSTGLDDLYRTGGVSGTVSGKDMVLKLAVDWQSAPPKYQIYLGCFEGNEIYGAAYDLVTTDSWTGRCNPVVNTHLIIKPEGAGFVELSDASGSSIRATLDELFAAKQKTMAQAVMSSVKGDQGERFYVTYKQGGIDLKHAGYAMYESDCNGGILKQDPRTLPDDFLALDTIQNAGFGKFVPEAAANSQPIVDLCARRFASKTGYHFGEME